MKQFAGDRTIVGRTIQLDGDPYGVAAVMRFGSAAAAMGRTLRIRGGSIRSPWMTVTGVVGDVRHSSLTALTGPEIYTSITKTSIPAMMGPQNNPPWPRGPLEGGGGLRKASSASSIPTFDSRSASWFCSRRTCSNVT